MSIPSFPPTIFVQLEVSAVVMHEADDGEVFGGPTHASSMRPRTPPLCTPSSPAQPNPACVLPCPQRAGTDRVMEDVAWLRRNNVKADVIMVRCRCAGGKAGRAFMGVALQCLDELAARTQLPPCKTDGSPADPAASLRCACACACPCACVRPPAVAHPHHCAHLLQRPLPRHLRYPVAAHRGGTAADRAGGRQRPARGQTKGQHGGSYILVHKFTPFGRVHHHLLLPAHSPAPPSRHLCSALALSLRAGRGGWCGYCPGCRPPASRSTWCSGPAASWRAWRWRTRRTSTWEVRGRAGDAAA